LQNYYPEGETEQDLIKKIKVVVFYPVGNTLKTVDISTIFENT
jgi:hypothetical protein